VQELRFDTPGFGPGVVVLDCARKPETLGRRSRANSSTPRERVAHTRIVNATVPAKQRDRYVREGPIVALDFASRASAMLPWRCVLSNFPSPSRLLRDAVD
jgi:hypothetical protein